MKKSTNPTLLRLKNADPAMYISLCEKAGCYNEVIDFYSTRINSPEDLLHAAELALSIRRYSQSKILIRKALEYVNHQVRSEASSRGIGLGAYESTRAMAKQVRRSASFLEERIRKRN